MSKVFGSIYRKERLSRKKLKALRKEKKNRFIQEKALELQMNTPASELWFYGKFSIESIQRIVGGNFRDQKNVPFHKRFIPDIINDGYRYIIEVDGDSHDNLKQAYKDFKKDGIYKARGYKSFRVKAYDDVSYNKFIKEFKEYVQHCHETFLLGLYSILAVYGPLPLFTNAQFQLIRKNERITKIQDVVVIEGHNQETNKSNIIRKPVTILRKAKPAI